MIIRAREVFIVVFSVQMLNITHGACVCVRVHMFFLCIIQNYSIKKYHEINSYIETKKHLSKNKPISYIILKNKVINSLVPELIIFFFCFSLLISFFKNNSSV